MQSPRFDHFASRIEDLVIHGSFALVTGDPGAGKHGPVERSGIVFRSVSW